MKRLLRNKLAFFGLVLVVLLALVALLAPLLASHDPSAIDLSNRLVGPSWRHPLGTDQLGRDLLSRMIYGSRISLSVGFVAVGISVLIGIALGSIAGYFGGRIDTLIMRFVDIMLCFPTFFLILSVIALLEPNIFTIMAVIGVTSWMGVARLIRAEILSLKEQEFILAARAIGAGPFRMIVRHLVPNAITPVLVSATLGIAAAILVESSLSFLGIGVQPPTPSWGNILTEGKSVLGIAWWLTLFPGLAILITVLAYNLLGEGLRDLLDPRLRDQVQSK
ncbi:MAG: ABC transporter permease [Candidatus Omnitrophica bacterium]|nr:ABC transporter permease [Candidatus Omnitrophota bacterium]